jgi:hypothetical protein
MKQTLGDEAKAWPKSNKGAVAVSFVKGAADSATLDFDGYEGKVVRKNNALFFETDDEDGGFQSLAAHVAVFCAARSRTLADVLQEVVRSFPKFVKDDGGDGGDDDDDDDGDSGGGSEEAEIAKWVNEEPVKKVKKTAADHVDASVFHTPSVARGAATQRLIADFAALKASDSKAIGFIAEPFELGDGKKNLYKWYVRLFPPSDSELYKVSPKRACICHLFIPLVAGLAKGEQEVLLCAQGGAARGVHRAGDAVPLRVSQRPAVYPRAAAALCAALGPRHHRGQVRGFPVCLLLSLTRSKASAWIC